MIKGRVNILGWSIFAHVKLSDVVSEIKSSNSILFINNCSRLILSPVQTENVWPSVWRANIFSFRYLVWLCLIMLNMLNYLMQFKFIVVIFIEDKQLIKHCKIFCSLDCDQTFLITFGHWRSHHSLCTGKFYFLIFSNQLVTFFEAFQKK